jgi:transposase
LLPTPFQFNLIRCNHYFSTLAAGWEKAGRDPRHTRVKVGMRFSRIAFQMVAGQQVFHHPCCKNRSYILEKLMGFHREHGTPTAALLADLQTALDQIPRTEYASEAVPLQKELQAVQDSRRRGPQPLGEILPLVLARLGVVQSCKSGDQDPT